RLECAVDDDVGLPRNGHVERRARRQHARHRRAVLRHLHLRRRSLRLRGLDRAAVLRRTAGQARTRRERPARPERRQPLARTARETDRSVRVAGPRPVEIKDAVAVVTGGASGLGLATTKRLLDAGAQVVVLDIRGKEAVAELGDRAVFAETDVTNEAAVTAALDAAEKLGPVRIV